MKNKRVLVTGGAGFIGANLLRMLLPDGYRVTVLDNLSTAQRGYVEGLAVEFIEGDILDSDLMNRTVAGYDAIIHLAAQTGVPSSLADPRRDCEVNVIGTLNLLEALRQASPDGDLTRFIFASSNAPLGRQTPPAREDKAPLPVSPYGASKLAGEAYCLAYQGSWGLETVVLRFANVYGPFSAHKSSVVARFYNDILTKGQVTIHGDGQQSRDFIYVGDLCRAIVAALESPVSGEVFQIATGVETTIADLAAMVRETVGLDIEVQHEQARRGDVRKNYSAVTKASEMLGWTPQVDIASGLRSSWTWFHKWSNDGSASG